MPKHNNPNLGSREAREEALQLLFEWSFGFAGLDEIVLTMAEAGRDEPRPYAMLLAETAVKNREELDRLVERYSQGWRLNRLSRVMLNTLRMALCEMTMEKGVPAGVAINEAVEIIKKYGAKEEPAYLNGVLGHFEQVRKGLKPEPPMPEAAEHTQVQPDKQDIQQPQNEQEPQPERTPDTADAVELIDGFDVEIE